MNEEHKAFSSDGYELKRVFTVPQGSVDTNWNPESANDFVNKSAAKKGTVGDLWSRSAELSEKRAKIYDGVDPLKSKSIQSHKKLRKGRLLGEEIKANREKTFEF